MVSVSRRAVTRSRQPPEQKPQSSPFSPATAKTRDFRGIPFVSWAMQNLCSDGCRLLLSYKLPGGCGCPDLCAAARAREGIWEELQQQIPARSSWPAGGPAAPVPTVTLGGWTVGKMGCYIPLTCLCRNLYYYCS